MSLLSNVRTKQVKMQTCPEPFALGRDDGQSGAIMVSKCTVGIGERSREVGVLWREADSKKARNRLMWKACLSPGAMVRSGPAWASAKGHIWYMTLLWSWYLLMSRAPVTTKSSKDARVWATT